MKKLLLVLFAFASLTGAQDKPRVFVQGKGSENVSSNGSGGGGRHWGAWGSKSTIDAHDESMEITKDFQRDCPGVIVSINQANADYIVMMNRESKQNRGLLRSNSQIQVANKAGDVLGTNATRTVGNAAKDACNLIVSDWQTHGRLNAQGTPSIPVAQAAVQAVVPTTPKAEIVPAALPVSASQPDSVNPAVPVVTTAGDSVADAARKEKLHRACLELAKDNPSIVCK
ncbi:MAG: hypothetical protein ACRD2U_08930 [Terriglobales bacterium]